MWAFFVTIVALAAQSAALTVPHDHHDNGLAQHFSLQAKLKDDTKRNFMNDWKVAHGRWGNKAAVAERPESIVSLAEGGICGRMKLLSESCMSSVN